MLIVCCGMIRSGSTLQYNLVRSLIETNGSGRGEGYISNPCQDKRLFMWTRNSTSHVVKMHGVADWMLEEPARQCIRFFFCHRDLRDVAASAKRKFGWPSPQIWGAIDAAIALQKRLQGIPEAQIHRYAEFSTEPSNILASIARFLGLMLEERVKSHIVSSCSLRNAQRVQAAVRDIMSSNGVNVGEDNKASIFDQTTLLHHNHISSNGGKDGAWHRDLTSNDLQTINGRYAAWQQSEGYAQT